MIKSKSGVEISLASVPNAHCLLLGQSGSGKTVGLNILIERAMGEGHRVLVVDYSDSFTLEEIEKAKVLNVEDVDFKDLSKETLVLPFLSGNKAKDVESISMALSESFEIFGRRQKEVLSELVYNIWEDGSVRFGGIMEDLDLMYLIEKDNDPDKARRIENLSEKLECLAESDFIELVNISGRGEISNLVTVLEFSGFPFETRKKVANFCLELYWKKIRCRQADMKTTRIVLDEVQNVGFRKTQAFTNMIREGRKFGLGVFMATQFENDTEKMELLMQAANVLLFKPTIRNARKTAKLIEEENWKTWLKILEQLAIGHFVLMGTYKINQNDKMHQTPILAQMEINSREEIK